MSPELRAALDAIGPQPQPEPGIPEADYFLEQRAFYRAQRDALLVALREAMDCADSRRNYPTAEQWASWQETLAKCGDAP